MLIPLGLAAAALLIVLALVGSWRQDKIMATGDMLSGMVSDPQPPWEKWDVRACPGGLSFYTTDSPTSFRRKPTDAEITALCGAPPAPNVSDLFPCPGDCINVLTHVWHSWYLTRNQLSRWWTLHVVTFAQYRCMSPDDPAARKPHVMGHPSEPSRGPLA
jgi:hypothetical protein